VLGCSEQDVKQFHTLLDMQVGTRKKGWGGRLRSLLAYPWQHIIQKAACLPFLY